MTPASQAVAPTSESSVSVTCAQALAATKNTQRMVLFKETDRLRAAIPALNIETHRGAAKLWPKARQPMTKAVSETIMCGQTMLSRNHTLAKTARL